MAGAPADKASRLVAVDEPIVVAAPPRYVGRGGEKLEAALERFAIDAAGRHALDVGASTGGFTDCLLQHGARSVVAVDVGRGQLHERLRRDPRVTVLEGTDVRALALEDPADLVSVDVSFISLRRVAAAIAANASAGADEVVLVKPQFEAGRREASRGRGVIRDPSVWRRVLEEATSALESTGAAMMGAMVSPLTGAAGNVEFLVHLRAASPETGTSVDFDALVEEAVARAGPAER